MKRPATAILWLLLLVVFAVLLAPRVMQVRELRLRSENLAEELGKLRKENQDLENQLRLLREDPVYLEKIAREKFNKAKQGEIVYKVVHENASPNAEQ